MLFKHEVANKGTRLALHPPSIVNVVISAVLGKDPAWHGNAPLAHNSYGWGVRHPERPVRRGKQWPKLARAPTLNS